MTVIVEGVESLVYLKNHIAALAAVSAVWAAVGNVELPAEAYMAVSAFAGADPYFRSVCKHENTFLI